MKRMILSIVSVAVLLALPASASMVRGTISDSATGSPISNVKVVLMQMAGEIELMIDSSRTGTTGSYSFAFSGQSGYGSYYIYTISNNYYYQTTDIGLVGINDTISKNIKLKRTPTMVSAAPDSKASQSITVRTEKSRLYLSGVKAGAIVDLYALNGRLLFRTAAPAGASEVMIPERIAAAGRYQVSIRTDGRLVRRMVISR